MDRRSFDTSNISHSANVNVSINVNVNVSDNPQDPQHRMSSDVRADMDTDRNRDAVMDMQLDNHAGDNNNDNNNHADDNNDHADDNGDDNDNQIPDEVNTHPAIQALVETSQAAPDANSGVAFLITDPLQPGNPIVYASPAFLRLTKYPLHRVLGRNCRFMQGPDTDPTVVSKIRRCVESGTSDCSVVLLNYRYDGSTFWNHLLITPLLRDEETGAVRYFLGVQYEVTADQAKVQQIMAETAASAARMDTALSYADREEGDGTAEG